MHDVGTFAGVVFFATVCLALVTGAAASGYARGRVDGVASVCAAIACEAPDTGVLCACPSPNREPDTDTGARETGEEPSRDSGIRH